MFASEMANIAHAKEVSANNERNFGFYSHESKISPLDRETCNCYSRCLSYDCLQRP